MRWIVRKCFRFPLNLQSCRKLEACGDGTGARGRPPSVGLRPPYAPEPLPRERRYPCMGDVEINSLRTLLTVLARICAASLPLRKRNVGKEAAVARRHGGCCGLDAATGVSRNSSGLLEARCSTVSKRFLRRKLEPPQACREPRNACPPRALLRAWRTRTTAVLRCRSRRCNGASAPAALWRRTRGPSRRGRTRRTVRRCLSSAKSRRTAGTTSRL